MYQHYFGLNKMPFNTTPDTRFFFHSEQLELAPQQVEHLLTTLIRHSAAPPTTAVTWPRGLGAPAVFCARRFCGYVALAGTRRGRSRRAFLSVGSLRCRLGSRLIAVLSR